ncbi:sigma factor [Streptomyces sp. NPDC046909]|uniref:RNA polymerase sigma factor n=1 Tax=Streptomyces sp. NPDC046909 TaxID=3155617 RepID=UPI0033EAF1FB
MSHRPRRWRCPWRPRSRWACSPSGFALGDAQASVAFVRRFQDAVYGPALSVTREPALAEDVSQDVFVRAWRAAGSYDARRASDLTWLLTVTRNATIDSSAADLWRSGTAQVTDVRRSWTAYLTDLRPTSASGAADRVRNGSIPARSGPRPPSVPLRGAEPGWKAGERHRFGERPDTTHAWRAGRGLCPRRGPPR